MPLPAALFLAATTGAATAESRAQAIAPPSGASALDSAVEYPFTHGPSNSIAAAVKFLLLPTPGYPGALSSLRPTAVRCS